MLFSRIKFATMFGLIFLPSVWLVGCYSVHNTADQQSAVMHTVTTEKREITQLKKLAEQGDAGAQYRLGLLYETGDALSQDDSKAFEWYEKSAKQGLASAQSKLGNMYRYGKGVDVNHAKATHWYFKAAEQGDQAAAYALGTIYLSSQ